MEKKTFAQKVDAFLMKDETFILLIMGAAAAIFAGTFMYIKFGTGAFNDIAIVQMLRDGLDGGDFAAAAGFAAFTLWEDYTRKTELAQRAAEKRAEFIERGRVHAHRKAAKKTAEPSSYISNIPMEDPPEAIDSAHGPDTQ